MIQQRFASLEDAHWTSTLGLQKKSCAGNPGSLLKWLKSES
jgi:hypothetical protein